MKKLSSFLKKSAIVAILCLLLCNTVFPSLGIAFDTSITAFAAPDPKPEPEPEPLDDVNYP